MKSSVLRELYCAHCDEPIGDYSYGFEEQYVTRKLYPTMRNFWPFHVDYSHYRMSFVSIAAILFRSPYQDRVFKKYHQSNGLMIGIFLI